jgi:hypothetical protein
VIIRLTRTARLLLGFVYLLNGLNWWWKVLPYPSISDPPLSQTPPFVQSMIDTSFMFGGTKVVEVAVGLALLANRWVPLALVVVFPLTVGIWSVDLFLISTSLRAQLMGWSVLLLNAFLLVAYLRYFTPMLVARASPRHEAEDQVPEWPSGAQSALSKRALATFGIVAVALGAAASGWLILMVAQRFAR